MKWNHCKNCDSYKPVDMACTHPKCVDNLPDTHNDIILQASVVLACVLCALILIGLAVVR